MTENINAKKKNEGKRKKIPVYAKDEIGYRQQMIMQCIWEAGEAQTVNEIIDRLEEKCGQRFAASTINTLILGLLKREYLRQGEKRGHAYLYEALISEEQFRQEEIRRFRHVSFGGSASSMVTALLSDEELDEDEIRKIRKILEKYEE